MSAALVAVTGTDTGCGKTVVAAALAASLRAHGLRVDALKLVATGVEPGKAGEDAELLARAIGAPARERVLETYALPRSPVAAAGAEGCTVDVESLIARVDKRVHTGGVDVVIVEGVGGLLVPLTPTVTVRDVLRRLDPVTLIVARAGLGTINHCALTVEACRAGGLRLAGVVMCDVGGVDSAFAAENAQQVALQCGVRVYGVMPHIEDPVNIHALVKALSSSVDVAAIVSAISERGDGQRARLRTSVVDADRAHAWHPFTQTSEWWAEEPLVIRGGDGCWLIDENGDRYLDGVASLWANVHGHSHPVLDRALHEQAGRIAHSTFLGLTHEPGSMLAAELCAVAPEGLSRVFFSEAGAAAVEVALRIAVQAQRYRGEPRRTRFVSLEDAYHGDTAAAVSVGRSDPFHRGLDPLLFDVIRVPPPHLAGDALSLEQLRAAFARHGEQVAALVIEPRVQGAAGVLPHTDSWLRSAIDIARRAGALVICDEVATGFGRTGDLFASSGAGIAPDILVLGKGLTGGYLPLSATLATEELFELFTAPYIEHRTLYYGHTYSANPLACAVARASLRLFETEQTVEEGRRLAARLARLLDEVRTHPGVREIRQRGVMAGIELAHEDGAPFEPALRVGRRVTLAARQRNVIVRPLGDVVVLNPPLVMSDAEAGVLVAAVAESISEVATKLAGSAAVALPGRR